MPRKEKPPIELTSEEAIKKLFPRPVVKEVKKEAEIPASPAKTSIDKKDK